MSHGKPSNPRTTDDVHAKVRSIWAQCLEVADVSPGDDFFGLGGDSLRAMQVMTALREEVGVEVPLVWLFEASTLRDFGARVERAVREQTGEPE